MNITRLQFRNIDTYKRYPLYLAGVPSFKLSHSVFENVTIYPDKQVITTDLLSELNINNVTFKGITSFEQGDDTNRILYIDSFDISQPTEFLISGVTVTESTLAFMSFDKITNYDGQVKTFTIDQFEYKDSIFTDKNNLLTFSKLELDTNFSIAVSNIKFTNVTFAVKGNLMYFQHQLKNALTITNMELTDTKNAQIYVSALNPKNKQLPLNLWMTNVTTSNVNAGFSSLIQVYESSHVEINDSNLHTVFNFAEGAVLYSSGQLSEVILTNCTMLHNSAINGAVFKSEKNGVVKISDSQITNNFAIYGGVLVVTDGGRFEISGCKMTKNIALQTSLGQISDAPISSIVSNCEMNSNENFGKSYILKLVKASLDCKELCFLSSEYKEYLSSRQDLLNGLPSAYLFQLVSSNLEVTNSEISSQVGIFDVFVATLTVQNTVIKNCEFSGIPIKITGSIFNFENVTMEGLSGPVRSRNNYMIRGSLESTVFMKNIAYIDCSITMFFYQVSTVVINNITGSNLGRRSSIGRIEQGVNTTISNFSFEDLQSAQTEIFEINNSRVREIRNMAFIRVESVGIEARSSVIDLITDSEFRESGSGKRSRGSRGSGFITSYNSNITITNSIFDGNTATSGAAFYHTCTGSPFCRNVLTNITFENNSATLRGGAIYYDIYRPIMTNLTFKNNSAPYGDNIASYPVKVIITDSNSTTYTLNDVASGQEYPKYIELSLVDYDNQIVSCTQSGVVSVNSVGENTNTLGRSSEPIVNGKVTFKEIIFVAEPGSKNVPFTVSTNTISANVMLKQFGKKSIQEPIMVNFRYCLPGEADFENTCAI